MTFARIAKLVALFLVIVAISRMRAPASSTRVVLLVLPSAAQDLIGAEVSSSWEGSIEVPDGISGSTFWRRLLTQDRIGNRDAADLLPFWSGPRAIARSVAVPVGLFGPSGQLTTAEGSFLGSSVGVVVESEDIVAGRIPAPYDRALAEVSKAAESLPRGAWSEWIAVPAVAGQVATTSAHEAEFQFVRFTDSSYFFSPVYVTGTGTIASSPFFRGADRELRPTIAAHSIALSRRRLSLSRALFDSSIDTRPVVVFDDLVEGAASVFTPDFTPSVVVGEVQKALVEEIRVLRGAVGDEGLLLLIGGPSTNRQAGSPAWYRIVPGGEATKGSQFKPMSSLTFEATRALVLYALGVSLDASEKSLLAADLTGRFPIRASVARGSAPEAAVEAAHEWSAATLESVPGAVGRRN